MRTEEKEEEKEEEKMEEEEGIHLMPPTYTATCTHLVLLLFPPLLLFLLKHIFIHMRAGSPPVVWSSVLVLRSRMGGMLGRGLVQ